jgi:hypothetical protein
MDYSNIDFENEPSSVAVYSKPRYILGKKDGPMIRFFTLSESSNGTLTVSSTSPRTVPASVFKANFSMVTNSRVGGVYIKTPSAYRALEAKEDGHFTQNNIETGVKESITVKSGEVLVCRRSGFIVAFSKCDFEKKFSSENPLDLIPPKVGRDSESDHSLS